MSSTDHRTLLVVSLSLFVLGGLAAGAAGASTAIDGVQAESIQNNATASLTYDGDRPTLRAAEGQTIEGETSLSGGTTLSVRLRSSGGSPFLKTNEVTVGEDGSFAATFDLSSVPINGSVPVTVAVAGPEGERLADADARLVPPGSGATDTPATTTSDTTPTETPGQPGFGVAIALVALAGAILLARRSA